MARSRAAAAAALAALLAAAAVVVARGPDTPALAPRGPDAGPRDGWRAREASRAASAVSAAASAERAGSPGVAGLGWRDEARTRLVPEVEARLGRALGAADRRTLLRAVADARRAGAIEARGGDDPSGRAEARRAARAAALRLRADRATRRRLGLPLAELMVRADAAAPEEIVAPEIALPSGDPLGFGAELAAWRRAEAAR